MKFRQQPLFKNYSLIFAMQSYYHIVNIWLFKFTKFASSSYSVAIFCMLSVYKYYFLIINYLEMWFTKVDFVKKIQMYKFTALFGMIGWNEDRNEMTISLYFHFVIFFIPSHQANEYNGSRA